MREFLVLDALPDQVAVTLQRADDEGWDLLSHAIYVVQQQLKVAAPGGPTHSSQAVFSLVFAREARNNGAAGPRLVT